MSKIGIIISREYATRVKKKSFIIATFLAPFLLALMFVIPWLVMSNSSDNKLRVIVVDDQSEVIYQKLQDHDNIKYRVVDHASAEVMKQELKAEHGYAILQISPLDSLNNVSASIFCNEQVSLALKSQIQSHINKILAEHKLESYDIPNLDAVLKNINHEATVKTFQLSKKDKEGKETSVGVYMGIGYASGFIIYFFIFMFGGLVMNGVVEEKSNRIIEVIVSSVKPMQLMLGKIIGIALVAITQFTAWVVLTFLILTGVGLFTGNSATEMAKQNTQAQAMISGVETTGIDAAAAAEAIDISSADNTFFSTLSQMNILGIIGTFLLYFLLGYLLYASMFAAVGACVDNQADTQQLLFPITIPLILGLFIMMSAFQNPNSSLAIWGSIIPFTSPMVMVARFSYGVPAWQYILSVTLLLGTFLFMGWVSAKIYRIGILSYGKKAGWKDIFRWLKIND